MEGERTRAFYIKKVEETQRKFEVQIRALKRGEQLDSNPAERGHSTSLHEAAGTSSALQQQQQQEALNQQVQQATRMYSERLALLEKELMTTAQELGRVKAANLARDREQQHQQQGVYPGHPYSQYPYGAPAGAPYLAPPAPHMPQAYSAPPPAPPSHQQQQARTNADTPPTSPSHQQQQQQHQPDSNKITSSERQELQARHEQRVEELTAAHNAHLSQLTMHWNVEREGLQKRLREEEARCAELRRELMNAVRGAAQSVGGVSGTTGADSTVTVVESKAPEMKQFLVRNDLPFPPLVLQDVF